MMTFLHCLFKFCTLSIYRGLTIRFLNVSNSRKSERKEKTVSNDFYNPQQLDQPVQ